MWKLLGVGQDLTGGRPLLDQLTQVLAELRQLRGAGRDSVTDIRFAGSCLAFWRRSNKCGLAQGVVQPDGPCDGCGSLFVAVSAAVVEGVQFHSDLSPRVRCGFQIICFELLTIGEVGGCVAKCFGGDTDGEGFSDRETRAGSGVMDEPGHGLGDPLGGRARGLVERQWDGSVQQPGILSAGWLDSPGSFDQNAGSKKVYIGCQRLGVGPFGSGVGQTAGGCRKLECYRPSARDTQFRSEDLHGVGDRTTEHAQSFVGEIGARGVSRAGSGEFMHESFPVSADFVREPVIGEPVQRAAERAECLSGVSSALEAWSRRVEVGVQGVEQIVQGGGH